MARVIVPEDSPAGRCSRMADPCGAVGGPHRHGRPARGPPRSARSCAPSTACRTPLGGCAKASAMPAPTWPIRRSSPRWRWSSTGSPTSSTTCSPPSAVGRRPVASAAHAAHRAPPRRRGPARRRRPCPPARRGGGAGARRRPSDPRRSRRAHRNGDSSTVDVSSALRDRMAFWSVLAADQRRELTSTCPTRPRSCTPHATTWPPRSTRSSATSSPTRPPAPPCA